MNCEAYIYIYTIPIETPSSSNCSFEKFGVSACGNAVDLIVRTHYTCRFAFHYTTSKRDIKCILYVLLAYLNINCTRLIYTYIYIIN